MVLSMCVARVEREKAYKKELGEGGSGVHR